MGAGTRKEGSLGRSGWDNAFLCCCVWRWHCWAEGSEQAHAAGAPKAGR